MPLLVFSPGIYSVSVDTPISATPGVAVLSDSPFTDIPVEVQAKPTAEFLSVVQERVEEFLTECATQEVLQPTGVPVRLPRRGSHRLAAEVVDRAAARRRGGAGRRRRGASRPRRRSPSIDVDIRSLFDGSIRHVSEDVPFLVTGTITVLPDGSATITVGGPDTD